MRVQWYLSKQNIILLTILEGAHTWTPTMHIKLVQDLGVDNVVAEHLSETYGDRAFEVGRNAAMTGLRWPLVGKRIHPEYPYIEAEVRYMFKLFDFGYILIHQGVEIPKMLNSFLDSIRN